MELQTKRYFKTQHIEILNKGLKINTKNLFESAEYELSFDHIENKRKVQTTINSNLLILGIFFFAFSFIFQLGSSDELTIIFLIISVIFIIVGMFTRKKYVSITSYEGENIELYFNNKNREEVINFADKIIESQNKYFLNLYGKIDKDLPTDTQLEGIKFLKNREIISEEEYGNLKDQLLGRNNKNSIGFGT